MKLFEMQEWFENRGYDADRVLRDGLVFTPAEKPLNKARVGFWYTDPDKGMNPLTGMTYRDRKQISFRPTETPKWIDALLEDLYEHAE